MMHHEYEEIVTEDCAQHCFHVILLASKIDRPAFSTPCICTYDAQ